MARTKGRKKDNDATLGFEEILWQAADKMRGHKGPSEYKHVVLGLIFLKWRIQLVSATLATGQRG